MFDHAVLESSYGNRRAFAAGAGFAGQTALAALIALAPIIWPQVLPKPQFMLTVAPTPPAPAPPEQIPAARPRTPHGPALLFRSDLLIPTRMPAQPQPIADEYPVGPPSTIGVAGGIGIAESNSVLDSILRVVPDVPKPPKALELKRAVEEVKRIRASSLDPARLIHMVEPVYPPLAKSAHIGGTVELSAVIGTDGRVRELNVISGHPLLRKAAIDAVRQWVYKPPVLNGESVEIVAPIAVIFRMN